ncbi:MAG: LETM1-related biofilm-associated protein [Flavobacteriaceae bacterium]
MNPSASGWIKKLLIDVIDNQIFIKTNEAEFYLALRSCGFMYGSNLKVVYNLVTKADFTEEEIGKTNLCLAFLHAHTLAKTKTPFVDSVINFYTEIDALRTSFFEDLLGGKKSSGQLEKIIHKRIQIDDNILTKNFNYHIINALLYVDVLAYQHYLKQNSITLDYVKNLEAAIETISLDVLNSKAVKNAYDDSLIKLFESSFRFNRTTEIGYSEAISHVNMPLEKRYLVDLACMATWSDKTIDSNEERFLYKLGQDLGLQMLQVENSINEVNTFYTVHKNSIALLSSKNIVQSFYNNSSKMVKKLITRNSKRLYKELKDSKELMVLLTQSTTRDLSQDEQKKVQDQLLDIFKSIPSLAIFLLPGGAILLPLVVKFIPKLLPSAFDENRIEE